MHTRRRAVVTGGVLLFAGVLATLVVLRGRPPDVPAAIDPSSPVAETASPTPPPPTPAPSATLELVHRNRLGSADLSVWVDDTLLWSTHMSAAKNPLARVGGDTVRRSLSVPAGRLRVGVHIRGRSMEVDARAAIEVNLHEGEKRTLRVTLNPYSEKLKLSFEE